MGASDFGFSSTINPKITLTLSLSGGQEVVEFYQAELHNSNKQGTFKVGLGNFPSEGLGPGEVVHEGFSGSPLAKIESNSGSNSDYVKTTWTKLGGLMYVLDDYYLSTSNEDKDGDGMLDEVFHSPEKATEVGPVTFAEASDWKTGNQQNADHPRWGLTENEKTWIRTAVQENAPIRVRIDYDDFGSMRSWTNASSSGYGYHTIADLWRPESSDQPETFTTSYGSLTAAVAQDSFETLAFSLRTSERMDGPASDLDPLRNLIDMNMRAIHSNSMWDGAEGYSRYLSLYDGAALGGNEQEPQSYTKEGSNSKHGFWGNSIESWGQRSVILFDKPRWPLLSLGQLQHANLGRYHFDPTYIIGNSYAHVRIPMDDFLVTDFGDATSLNLFDLSYLVNERIWDGFFFSTLDIPQTVSEREGIIDDLENTALTLADLTLNPRMEFIDSDTGDAERYEQIVVSDPADDNFESAIYRPASEMWVNGAFNVNSTSVEAWKAVLSSTQGLRFPIYSPENSTEIITETDVSFSRSSRPYNYGFKAGDPTTESEFWKGYRTLSSAEVTDLAESIVEQIKARGPFLSLASFVNRRLTDDEFGKKGALQAALDDPSLGSNPDLAVNDFSDLHPDIGSEPVVPFTQATSLRSQNLAYTDETIMGLPGYVLQSDVLQQIGSFLTVRSDTFTVRAYGDVVDPITNEVTSRVFCEAKVQRVPEPMTPVDSTRSEMEELIQPSSAYGRRLQIVSIKWLNADEI